MTDILAYVGPAALALAGWLFKEVSSLKTAVAVLQAERDNMYKHLNRIEEKLDRLIEKEGA